MSNILIGAPLQANGPFPITITATFSNATRPAASTWTDGFIWNTDALAVQFSNGTAWFNTGGSGGIITWTQSQSWASIVAQIQPNTGTIVMLVDDGTSNDFSLNAASGDLSSVLIYAANTFFDSPFLFVDTGWSTTGAYLQFNNVVVTARTASLISSGSTVEVIQGTNALFESVDSPPTTLPLIVLDPGAALSIGLDGALGSIQAQTTTSVVVMGQGSSIGLAIYADGAVSITTATPAFALASGATAATVTIDAKNGSVIDPGSFQTGITVKGNHSEQGSAAFTTGGTGAGHDYVDVVFNIPYVLATDWVLTSLIPLLTTDGDPAPVIYYSFPSGASATGFRIRTNAPFNGTVEWAASSIY